MTRVRVSLTLKLKGRCVHIIMRAKSVYVALGLDEKLQTRARVRARGHAAREWGIGTRAVHECGTAAAAAELAFQVVVACAPSGFGGGGTLPMTG